MSARTMIQAPRDPQRVPAWKRLGLKLKDVNSGLNPEVEKAPKANTSIRNVSSDTIDQGHPHKKRRVASTPTYPRPIAKVQDLPGPQKTQATGGRSNKRVAFAADTKHSETLQVSEPSSTHHITNSKEMKKSKQPRKVKFTLPSKQKSEDALHYLDQFHQSHDIWKFNKSREIWILKNAFSVELIPPSYDQALASYLRGLKGKAATTRLRESAENILVNGDRAGSKPEEVQDGAEAPSTQIERTEQSDNSNEIHDNRRAKRDRAKTIFSATSQGRNPATESGPSALPRTNIKLPPSKSTPKNVIKAKQTRKLRTPIAADISSSSSAESSDSDGGDGSDSRAQVLTSSSGSDSSDR